MTDQPEKLFKCPRPGCASTVPASGKDEHMKGHRDRAAFENRVNQFLTRFEGSYLPDRFTAIDDALQSIDGSIESLDSDTANIIRRLDALETRPTAEAPAPVEGVQISGWIDDETDQPIELPTPVEEPEPIAAETPEEPAYPALAPVYSTATDPAEVDDLEARIAAQTASHL